MILKIDPTISDVDMAALASLFGAIGEDNFSERLCCFVGSCVSVDGLAAYLYRPDIPPTCLFDNIKTAQRRELKEVLFAVAYWISPYYNRLFSKDCQNGFYGLADLIPDDFNQTEYYQIYFREKKCVEEGIFVVNLSDQIKVGIIIERLNNSPYFSDEDFRIIGMLMPVIEQAIKQHFHRYRLPSPSHEAGVVKARLELAFNLFGAGELSAREREVARLCLQGHSSKSAARVLGISPETERVHRKKLYGKLSIASQSELFWKFITFVSEGNVVAPVRGL